MCDPVTLTAIAIGAGVGAAGAAATGGDPLMGALMGGASGGFMAGGSIATNLALATTSSGVATGTAVGISAGVLGGAGTIASSLLMPKAPDYTGYTPASYQVQQQQFNSQQIATTGSGGRQASASLAEAISRSKKRKLSQADVSDLSIDTSSFASTGLQFA
jgi:hypothetical protein